MTLEEFKKVLSGTGLKFYQNEDKDYMYIGFVHMFNDTDLTICEFNKIEESAKVIHHKYSKFIKDDKEVWDIDDNPEESITEFRAVKNFQEALINEFKIIRSVNSDSSQPRRN